MYKHRAERIQLTKMNFTCGDTDLCRTVPPLPADGRDATALPGLRAAPTDVALAEAGCQHKQRH